MYNPLFPNDYSFIKVQEYFERNKRSHHATKRDLSGLSSGEDAENNGKKSLPTNFLSAALRSSTVPSLLDSMSSHSSTSTVINDSFQATGSQASSMQSLPATLPPPSTLFGRASQSIGAAASWNLRPGHGNTESGSKFQTSVGTNPPLPAPLIPSTRLDMSAEELHAQRIQRSAQMGVQRAVDLRKDEIETEFKKRKLEGSDTKSKVSNLLSQLRQKKAAAAAAGNITSTMISMPSDSNLTHLSTASISTSSSAASSLSLPSGSTSTRGPSDPCETSAPRSLSAPLTFVPSGLRSGGFVMTATEPSAQEGISVRLEGRPSTTLLLRHVGSPSLWEAAKLGASEEQVLRGFSSNSKDARQQLASAIWSQSVRDILHRCTAFGVVSSHQVYVLTEKEENHVKERLLREFPATSPSQCNVILLSERVRVFVRFEAPAGAFKAADAMSVNLMLWKVCFFPSEEYDQGHLAPIQSESWSQVPHAE